MTETCAMCRWWGERGAVFDLPIRKKNRNRYAICGTQGDDDDPIIAGGDGNYGWVVTREDFACNQWEGRE